MLKFVILRDVKLFFAAIKNAPSDRRNAVLEKVEREGQHNEEAWKDQLARDRKCTRLILFENPNNRDPGEG